MKTLLLNAGSSSLKFSVLESCEASVIVSGMVDWASNVTRYRFSASDTDVDEEVAWKGQANSVKRVLDDIRQAVPGLFSGRDSLKAVGHRIVHGGEFTDSTQITPSVRTKLVELASLAPLHNPPSLEAFDAASELLPEIIHIACFDTAFHRTMIPAAQIYAIPHEWTSQWKIRRYGFHGHSHAYCAKRAGEMLSDRPPPIRLAICHLGHGCSVSAVRDERCMDTTMGFTPLEGLMMATRSGSLDPEVTLYLQRHCGLTPDEISETLNRRSGLLGVSGVSPDMRVVMASAQSGNEQARLAVAMYCHKVRQAIASMAVTIGGIDALVFTAGVGENSADVRAEICSGLQCLGLHLESRKNLDVEPDSDVATANSPARILVIRTREDLNMLQDVMRVVEDFRLVSNRPS